MPDAMSVERRRDYVDLAEEVREIRDYVQRDIGAKNLLLLLVSTFGVICASLGYWMVSSTRDLQEEVRALRVQVAQHELYGHPSLGEQQRELSTQLRLFRLEFDNLKARLEENQVIRPRPQVVPPATQGELEPPQ